MDPSKKSLCIAKRSQKAKGRVAWNKGKHWSLEVKAKLSTSHKGQRHSEEWKRKLSERMRGERHFNWGKKYSLDFRRKLSLAHKGQHSSPRTQFQNLPPEKRIEIQRKAIAARHKRPNKYEEVAAKIIDKACPSEYRFTGDGSFSVGSFNPDFVNVNGKKKLIEIFGEYWHARRHALRWHQTELGRIMLYNAFGFDCLILWVSELDTLTEEELVQKIRGFNNQASRVKKKG